MGAAYRFLSSFLQCCMHLLYPGTCICYGLGVEEEVLKLLSHGDSYALYITLGFIEARHIKIDIESHHKRIFTKSHRVSQAFSWKSGLCFICQLVSVGVRM
jgi:hypothetical protein